MEGTVTGLPKGQQLWVVKEPVKGQYHPDRGPALINGNTWTATAYVGNNQPNADQGKRFVIHIVMVSPSTGQKFNDYINQAEQKNQWPGIPTLYDGKIVATVTVIRRG
jgi:hypothetical protein